MMWATQLFPYMRIWLPFFYEDFFAIPATHFSIDRDNWDSLIPCITPEMTFRARPPGTAIPLSVRQLGINPPSRVNSCQLDINPWNVLTIFSNFAFPIDASGCAFGTRTPTNVRGSISILVFTFATTQTYATQTFLVWRSSSRCMCSWTLHSN